MTDMLKKFTVAFALAFSMFIFKAFAQEKTEWARVESANKEISVALPSNFLVDAVKKDYNNQSLRLISFQNGVQMEFLVYSEENPQKYLRELKVGSESKTINSGGNSFTLKRISGGESVNHFSETVFLASKKSLYCFYIRAENGDKPEVSRFLYSIKAGDKSIFKNKEQEKKSGEKNLSVDQMKTSPEILTALNQPFKNESGKINYEFKRIEAKQEAADFSIRPAIILVDPFPSGSSLSVRPALLASYVGQNSGTATIKIKLLANGQIGNVTVFSISNRKILYEFIEGIKKIRFFPAMKDGNPIDSEISFEFEFPYY